MSESVNSEWSEILQSDVVPRLVRLASGISDSIGSATDDQDLVNKAERLRDRFDEISNYVPRNIVVRSRIVRGTDRLQNGEYPGFWVSASMGNIELSANIYGGIRDPKARMDMLDNVKRSLSRQSHSERTLGLGDKATQINIQVRTGGKTTDEVWAMDIPGHDPRINITSFKVDGDPAMVSAQSPIIFGRSTNTGYNYQVFHREISELIALFLHNTSNI